MHQERGASAPVVRGTAPARECDFCDGRTHVHQERGASAPRGSRNRTCKGFAPMSVRLPTVHQRTPTQSRCYILDNIHGGLTPAALVPGESPPACAWRFLLHARSRNHDGLTPAALASECERLPAKLQLLRCTNACAPGAGGVSPRGSRNRTCKGVRVTVSAIADRASADPNAVAVLHPRQHSRRADARRSCVGRIAPACALRFPLHACSPNHGGLTPAALVSECERLPAKLPLLRCTNAHAPGAGGVSPPWFTVTHVQGLRANVGAIADRASADSDAVAVLHPRQHSRRTDTRRSCLRRIAACLCVAISLARAFS
jgi:hypothetical protein